MNADGHRLKSYYLQWNATFPGFISPGFISFLICVHLRSSAVKTSSRPGRCVYEITSRLSAKIPSTQVPFGFRLSFSCLPHPIHRIKGDRDPD